MTEIPAQNLSSLKMVYEELVATIDQAAGDLEQFITDREDVRLLSASAKGMSQVAGTLAMIQIAGGQELATEAVALADHLSAEPDQMDRQLSAITKAYFLLNRYLEYVLQTQRELPVLLIPGINELRLAHGQPALADSHFFKADLDCEPLSATKVVPKLQVEDMKSVFQRLRHMYQVGLLGVLKNSQVKPSLGMMQRAAERMTIIQGDTAYYTQWLVGARMLCLLSQENMDLHRARKMLLSQLDREFKAALKGTQSEQASTLLLKDLLYVIASSCDRDSKTIDMLEHFGAEPSVYSDRDLAREREALNGPSANTLQSMATVLNDELKHTKEILERASLGGASSKEDFTELLETLSKVAEILNVVGLVAPGKRLKEAIEQVATWQRKGLVEDEQELLDLADVMLYIESAVAGMAASNLSDESLAAANSAGHQEVIAQSQLAEAELIVVGEAEAGLSLVKRALSSYAESNYDRGHINNVTTILNAIRGAMVMLGLDRAERVAINCIDFVEAVLLDSEQQAAMGELLETFADAIISMEYYLDGIKGNLDMSDEVLEVAEASLAALGFEEG